MLERDGRAIAAFRFDLERDVRSAAAVCRISAASAGSPTERARTIAPTICENAAI